jgi:uncharacterized membrane protein (UPF0127 family)
MRGTVAYSHFCKASLLVASAVLSVGKFRGNLLQVTKLPALWFDGEVVAERVQVARSARTRMRGLVMRPSLAQGDALLLEPARQIHTFGMRFAIDVVFCDRKWEVVHVVRSMRPNRLTRWVPSSRLCVEMNAGTLPMDLTTGDRLELK